MAVAVAVAVAVAMISLVRRWEGQYDSYFLLHYGRIGLEKGGRSEVKVRKAKLGREAMIPFSCCWRGKGYG